MRRSGCGRPDAYAKIAPASPHAQHMTSHIYLALGMWDETVAANERTIQPDQRGYASARTRTRRRSAAAIRLRGFRMPICSRAASPMRCASSKVAARRCEAIRSCPSTRWVHRVRWTPTTARPLPSAVMRSRYLIDSGDWSGPVAAMKVNIENLITAEFTRDWADAYGAVRFGKLDAAVAAIDVRRIPTSAMWLRPLLRESRRMIRCSAGRRSSSSNSTACCC